MNTLKTTFYILCFLITFLSCQTGSKQLNSPSLQFDGLYFTKKNTSDDTNHYRYYLRFYKNGKVIGSASSGEPKDVMKWLNMQTNNLSLGEYVIKKNRISFDLKSELGEVSYKGEIFNKKLNLSSESKINGFKSTNQYKFQNMNLTN